MSSFVNPFAPKVGEVKDITKPTSGKQNADDIEDIFNQDDNVDDDKEKKEDKKDSKKDDEDKEPSIPDIEEEDEDTEDEDEDEELELKEDEEEEEEKLDLKKKDDEIKVPPRKKEILAKYPKFFQEFPFFEKMMFRDKQYNELFGSFDNAREVAEKAEQFAAFEGQVLDGNLNNILKVVKENSPQGYDRLVDDYLEVLEKTDKDAFREVMGNYMKRVILGMNNEAQQENNKDLHEQAKALYKYLFNTTKWEDPTRRTKVEDSDEVKKLNTERQQFTQRKYNDAATNLQTKVDNVLRSTITDHIDPKNEMSNFERKKAVEDVLNRLHSRNDRDKTLIQNLNKLWKNAFANDFSSDSLEAIRKTYLGKSRGELSSIIKEVRGEVLKDKSPRSKPKEDEDEDKPAPRQSKLNVGRPNQQTPKAKDRQKGESVEDYFARD